MIRNIIRLNGSMPIEQVTPKRSHEGSEKYRMGMRGVRTIISHTPTTYPEYLKGDALVAYLKTLPPHVVEQLANLDSAISAQVLAPTVTEAIKVEARNLPALYVAAILGGISLQETEVQASSEPQ
jgi:hypothetical protein